MKREQVKQPRGKFLLAVRVFGRHVYLHEMGTANVGTPDEQPYINWTQFMDEAQDFETVKSARAMVRKLSACGYDSAIKICRRNGR